MDIVEKIRNSSGIERFGHAVFLTAIGIFFYSWFLIFDLSNLEQQNALQKIFGFISAIISSFAACVFVRIWYDMQEKPDDKGKEWDNKDHGLLLLATALFIWSVSGILPSFLSSEKINYLGPAISTLNNYCFIASLYYFDNGAPNYSNKILKAFRISKDNYLILVAVVFSIVFIFCFTPFSGLVQMTDFIISWITLFLLGRTLFISFRERKLYYLAFLVFLGFFFTICIISIFYFQPTFLNLISSSIILKLAFPMIYKVIIIFLFGALAVSWLYSIRLSLSEEKLILSEEKSRLLEFQKHDMLHLIRNTITNLHIDYSKQQRIWSKKDNPTILNFLTNNMVRIDALRILFDEIFLKKDAVDLYSFMEKVLKNLELQFGFKHFQSDLSAVKELNNVRGDAAQDLAKVLTELVINSFKHGEKWVEIQSCIEMKEEAFLVLRITDKGKGYNVESIHPSRFGHKAIRDYLESLGGKPLEQAKGLNQTSFIVQVPIRYFYKRRDSNNFIS